jgi:hypothetical protein
MPTQRGIDAPRQSRRDASGGRRTQRHQCYEPRAALCEQGTTPLASDARKRGAIDQGSVRPLDRRDEGFESPARRGRPASGAQPGPQHPLAGSARRWRKARLGR